MNDLIFESSKKGKGKRSHLTERKKNKKNFPIKLGKIKNPSYL